MELYVVYFNDEKWGYVSVFSKSAESYKMAVDLEKSAIYRAIACSTANPDLTSRKRMKE